MKRSFLLPHWCKVVGLSVMVPFTVVGLILIFIQPDWLDFIWDGHNVMATFITLLSVSMLTVAFSCEKDEDEYVASERSKYLMLAFWIDFAFVAITSFTVYGLDYLNIMTMQMFLVLFLHIVMFNTAMFVIRRRRSREE